MKLRTLVVGTTFGESYIKALRRAPGSFEIVGILAGGSERSREVAAKYDLPLYTEEEKLPGDIDLAAVILRSNGCGGVGSDVAIRLMNRGISVLHEQPVHSSWVKECLKAAVKNDVWYETADFYSYLPQMKKLSVAAEKLQQNGKTVYVRAAFPTQLSYSAVRILTGLLSSREKFKRGNPVISSGPFRLLSTAMGEIPITIEYQNELCPDDPDGLMHLFHEFTLFYPGGRLALGDSCGSLVFRPRPEVAKEKYSSKGIGDGHMCQPVELVLYRSPEESLKDFVENSWIPAMTENLLDVRNKMLLPVAEKRALRKMHAAKEVLWADKWEEIHEIFGYADWIKKSGYEPFRAEELL